MSENYTPSTGAEPDDVESTARLSQRDIGFRIPINFVTSPGVSLTAACFSHLKYEDADFAVCLSNLLAVGFRRLQIDLYWDQGRNVWSFCPAALPSSYSTTSASGSRSAQSSTSLAVLSTPSAKAELNVRQATGDGSSTSSESTSTSQLTTSTTRGASSLGSTLPSIVSVPSSPNTPLVTIGPYTCTTTINLLAFTSLLSDYIDKTDDTLTANLLYVYINIHAAASSSSPTTSPQTPANNPSGDALVSNLFKNNMTDWLYTPDNLSSGRANINGSWYTVSETYRPVMDYYTVTMNEYNVAMTPDGWTSESYVIFSKSKRLLLGWGTTDPQMSSYNFSADSSTIFPADFIQNPTNITATSGGDITSGCFLQPNTNSLSISHLNSSWSRSSLALDFTYPTTSTSSLTPLKNLTSTTTNCGISPLLNTTLLSYTASQDYTPYKDYAASTMWSWAPNEPKAYTDPSNYHCATTSTTLSNHWHVSDCTSKHPVACRANSQPYNWTLSTSSTTYALAISACPSGYTFAAPRTALENAYLGQAIKVKGLGKRASTETDTWLDFNALDEEGCWVSGGADAACPYKNTLMEQDFVRKRVILVPTVAAIIVLIVTALTVFVKAAGNHKSKKRKRKRAENGFVYEGVPS